MRMPFSGYNRKKGKDRKNNIMTIRAPVLMAGIEAEMNPEKTAAAMALSRAVRINILGFGLRKCPSAAGVSNMAALKTAPKI
jgi:hypothetical protein